jgi:hypothetical protein
VSSAPAPQFDPVEPLNVPDSPVELAPVPEAEAPLEETEQTESAEVPPYEYIGVIHLTRTWVQYGIFGFAVLCIVIGAVEALFGR